MTTIAGRRAHRPVSYSGIWSWITTVDHKRIGILYGATAFFYFLVGGLEAILIRLQLIVPNNNFVSADLFNQLFTMHGTTMVFLVIMPLSAAFFNFMIPLMIGARDVAFPRLNALSYWLFLFGGLLLHISLLFGGMPDAGWFGYANLTSNEYSPGVRIDFWLLGLQVLGVSSLAAAFNFLVTIINMRAPGMTLLRMPVFVWMSLVTMVLLVLAFPAITVGLILLLFDRFFDTHFFLREGGGDPVLWQHLFWVFGHPEVYILILPAMGIISEVLPVFSRKPLFGYAFIVYSGVAIGFLAFGVWAHHMFAVGMGPIADAVFAVNTMLIAIPTGVKIFNWLGTVWAGSLNNRSPLYFALGFIGMFTIGGLSGVMHASPPADLQQTDTYFIVAHIHYVLFGGAILGIFAGIHYWFPKMTGRMLDDSLGKLTFWVLFVGLNLAFFPMHFSGLFGMPRRIYTYGADLGVGSFNLMSTVGALILGVGILIFMANAFISLRRGEQASADPWDGATLEWSIPSPPPVYNFATIPHVHSRDAFWAMKDPARVELAHAGRPPADSSQPPPPAPPADGETAGHGGVPAGIHMPNPSYWPIVVAIGLFLMMTGLAFTKAISPGFGFSVSLLGILTLFVGIYAWVYEPVG